jgi:hypothetical protein
MKLGSEIPPTTIFAHEAEMIGLLVIALFAVVFLSIRRWGARGWIATAFVFPLAVIWWFAYPIVALGIH